MQFSEYKRIHGLSSVELPSEPENNILPTIQSERTRTTFNDVKPLINNERISIDESFIIRVNRSLCDFIRSNDSAILYDILIQSIDYQWNEIKSSLFNSISALPNNKRNHMKLDAMRQWISSRFRYLIELQYPQLRGVTTSTNNNITTTQSPIDTAAVTSLDNNIQLSPPILPPVKRIDATPSPNDINESDKTNYLPRHSYPIISSRVGDKYQANVPATTDPHIDDTRAQLISGTIDTQWNTYIPPIKPILQPGEEYGIHIYDTLDESDYKHLLKYDRTVRTAKCRYHLRQGGRCARNCPYRRKQSNNTTTTSNDTLQFNKSTSDTNTHKTQQSSSRCEGRLTASPVPVPAPHNTNATSSHTSIFDRLTLPQLKRLCRWCNTNSRIATCTHLACTTCCTQLGMDCKIPEHQSEQAIYELIDMNNDHKYNHHIINDIQTLFQSQCAERFYVLKTIHDGAQKSCQNFDLYQHNPISSNSMINSHQSNNHTHQSSRQSQSITQQHIHTQSNSHTLTSQQSHTNYPPSNTQNQRPARHSPNTIQLVAEPNGVDSRNRSKYRTPTQHTSNTNRYNNIQSQSSLSTIPSLPPSCTHHRTTNTACPISCNNRWIAVAQPVPSVDILSQIVLQHHKRPNNISQRPINHSGNDILNQSKCIQLPLFVDSSRTNFPLPPSCSTHRLHHQMCPLDCTQRWSEYKSLQVPDKRVLKLVAEQNGIDLRYLSTYTNSTQQNTTNENQHNTIQLQPSPAH